MQKIRIRIAVVVLLAMFFSITSCKYEKLLKTTDYKYKYNEALVYYEIGDYSRAQGLFEQLRPILQATKQADTVFFYNAYCSYYLGDLLLAAHYFEEFYRMFGNSHFALEAEYMSAYSNYLLSPKPSLDQSRTKKAINDFTIFISRHPDSEYTKKAHDIIKELRNKLVEKSFISAKLYYKLEKYNSAVIALNNSLEEFPDTKYREEIMYMVVKAAFFYAENSIKEKQEERYQATIDEYYSFLNEFPDSKYIEEMNKIYETSLEAIGK